MDTSLWPAAIFGFLFVLLGVMRLARTSEELVWGAGLAAVVSALIVFVSPVALVPIGFLVVAMAWWRTDTGLASKRPESPLTNVWAPSKAHNGGERILASLVEGWGQGTQQAQERGLVPWAPPAGTPTQEADGLVDRSQRRNPFRPEGAMGLRTGVKVDTHTLDTKASTAQADPSHTSDGDTTQATA